MERLRRPEHGRQRPDEEPRQAQTLTAPPAAPPDPAQTAQVQVIYGASVQTFPLAGLQVSHAREVLANILQIDPRAPMLVNGQPVSQSHRLASGETLEFVHHAGEKGAVHGHPLGDRGRAARL
jgi:hypothetical protein